MKASVMTTLLYAFWLLGYAAGHLGIKLGTAQGTVLVLGVVLLGVCASWLYNH